ncbi:hypothetical protein DPMN_066957 [Dreissena polymorpha]|uniref:Uncharacterized protein n=1 Tax=Dreissena polymorpha TaxID=45954 RepID=A0A9D3YZE2_DREPO|nr:hypothetical protein DPMN_066957 [Dreissena polymorpha]
MTLINYPDIEERSRDLLHCDHSRVSGFATLLPQQGVRVYYAVTTAGCQGLVHCDHRRVPVHRRQ